MVVQIASLEYHIHVKRKPFLILFNADKLTDTAPRRRAWVILFVSACVVSAQKSALVMYEQPRVIKSLERSITSEHIEKRNASTTY